MASMTLYFRLDGYTFTKVASLADSARCEGRFAG